jgi:radical SAM protein with 4Fe4S-binding SPASM domain
MSEAVDASTPVPAPERVDDAFPVLADHVRIQPLADFVKVVHVRSGQILHLSRREAVCLELARGKVSLGEIVDVVAGVYRLDAEAARQGVLEALDTFSHDVEWRAGPSAPRTVSDPLRLFDRDPELLSPAPYRQERPTRLILCLTDACNYRCHHCANGSGLAKAGELTDDEWGQVISTAGDLGVVSVTFSGGEPLLRPGLPDLVGLTTARGMYPVLSTNASLIDRTTAERLTDGGLRFAHVSLVSATGDGHATLTGRRGWFTRALDGIGHLLDRGVYVRLKMVLLPGNVGQVPQLLDLADSLGVQEVHLAPYRLTHLAPGGASLLLTPEMLTTVATGLDQWRRRTGSGLAVVAPDEGEERLSWSGAGEIVRCGGVKQELTVLPDGRITVCEVLRDRPEFVLGHVLRDGLQGVWQSSRPEQVMEERAAAAVGPCRGCEHLPVCGTGCFSLSLACGGLATGADPRCWKAEYDDNPFRGAFPGPTTEVHAP